MGVPIGTAELLAVAGKDRADFRSVLLKEGQHILIEEKRSGHRQFAGIKPAPGVP